MLSQTEQSGSPWRRRAVVALFALAVVVAGSGYYWRLDQYPAYMDFDSATLGIFVNNLTFHGRVDYFFSESGLDQDRYRMFWGAQFLPVAAVLSGLQRLLGLRPDQVGELLGGATMALGLMGCLLAGSIVRRSPRYGSVDALFLVAFCAAFPPYLLYVRTEVPNFLYSFCLFWLTIYCLVRFLESLAWPWALATATAVAVMALLPYTPILWLPVVGLWLAIERGRLRQLLGCKAAYVAAACGVALFAALQWTVAVQYEGSYPQWRAKVERFLAQRSRYAVSTQNLQLSELPRKAELLLHQHFYFQHDQLGDPTRRDELWTLPTPHIVWLLLLPVGLLGLWRGLRERDPTAHVFASVLAAAYAAAFTVSTPEGRYLLAAVPSYAFFVCAGVRELIRPPQVRTLVLSAVLVAMSVNTMVLLRGEYDTIMQRVWRQMAGMRPSLELIRERRGDRTGSDDVLYLSWPELSYFSWLYLQMLGNLRVTAFDLDDLGGIARAEQLFAVVEATDVTVAAAWKERGFEVVEEVVDPASGRRFVVHSRDGVRRTAPKRGLKGS